MTIKFVPLKSEEVYLHDITPGNAFRLLNRYYMRCSDKYCVSLGPSCCGQLEELRRDLRVIPVTLLLSEVREATS